MKVAQQHILVCPKKSLQVALKANVEWTINPHNRNGQWQYIVQTDPASTSKPKWAHVLLGGSKAVAVTSDEVLAEIATRTVGRSFNDSNRTNEPESEMSRELKPIICVAA